MEDTMFAFKQMGQEPILIFYVISLAFLNALFGIFGTTISKNATSLIRNIINNLKSFLVWLFFLIVPTKISEKWSWLQFIRFILMIVGTVIFNEILIIPFWGFNKNTKEEINKEDKEENNQIITGQYKDDFSAIENTNTDNEVFVGGYKK